MKTVKVKVTVADISKSLRNPAKCPVTRAVARLLRESIDDVEIKENSVYIWDEWDSPCQIYTLDDNAGQFICNWDEESHPKPFNFEMKKRK